jgi:hypothetical protein
MPIEQEYRITVERHGRRCTGTWALRGRQLIVRYAVTQRVLDIGQGGASPETLATMLLTELIDEAMAAGQ